MTNREALVKSLAESLRRAPDAEQWDALARGELTPEEVEKLTAEPAGDPAREQALVEQAMRAHQTPPKPARSNLGKVVRFAYSMAAVLCVALITLFVIGRRPTPDTPPVCTLVGKGDALVLSPDAGAVSDNLVVSPGTRVRIQMSPNAPIEKDLIARLYVVSGTQAIALPSSPSPGKTIQIEALREDLFPNVPAGTYDLVILVAFVGTEVDEQALSTMARDPSKPVSGWRDTRRKLILKAATTGQFVPSDETLEKAKELRTQGKMDEALAVLESTQSTLASTRLKARLLMDLGKLDESAPTFSRAIQDGSTQGDVAGTGKDILALVYLKLELQRDAAGAAALMEHYKKTLVAWREGAADIRYNQGKIARAQGDLRAALAHLFEAESEARVAQKNNVRDAAREVLADIYSTLGRHAEALSIEEKIDLPTDGCEGARVRNNAAWIKLRAIRAGAGGDAPETVLLLQDALRLARTYCPYAVGKILTNLAIALAEDGDPNAARAVAAEASLVEAPSDPEDAVWWDQVSGETDLAANQPELARVAFKHMRTLGAVHRLPEATFEGALGEAVASNALGRVGEAEKAFREAEETLDDWSNNSPLGEGRGTFLMEHARGVRLYTSFLLEHGRVREALSVVGRSTHRYFSLVNEPYFHKLPHSSTTPTPFQLSVPALLSNGKVAMAALHLPSGPTVLVANEKKAISTVLSDLTPTALGNEPSVVEMLSSATQLNVSAGGAFRHVDVHALPFQGKPLVAHLPVAYSLHLPTLETQPSPTPEALLVTDPAEDLPAVRATTAAVSEALGKQGFTVRHLSGQDATRADFEKMIARPQVEFLYYAGHASFAGLDGLDAALNLADGPFSVRDVLQLPHVPTHAVLLACSSAQTDATVDSFGLAHALLIKGTQAVVAARTELDVAVVERLGASLASDLGTPPQLPLLLSRVQATLAVDAKPVNWQILRALTR
ncbi:MAG: CHAT domain-containing protein [Polyangiaceae bacterium]|nr:CHAT domain-containing protein [Polyangiaceae bacterium]